MQCGIGDIQISIVRFLEVSNSVHGSVFYAIKFMTNYFSECNAPDHIYRLSSYGFGAVEVKSPNYPNNYDGLADLSWFFEADEGHRIKFFVVDFDVSF